MITSIWIDNFKSLVDFKIELAKFNCVVGLNGAGKSTLLHALDFINFAVKPLALAGGYKAAIPKVLDCGKAQFNTFMVSLKRREFRAENC